MAFTISSDIKAGEETDFTLRADEPIPDSDKKTIRMLLEAMTLADARLENVILLLKADITKAQEEAEKKRRAWVKSKLNAVEDILSNR